MTTQKVWQPVTGGCVPLGTSDAGKFVYWDGDDGLADPSIFIDESKSEVSLSGMALCRAVDVDAPQERIAAALERIAAALEAIQTNGLTVEDPYRK